MKTLDEVLTDVLQREGWPAVTDRAADRGGLTRGGITLKNYNAWLRAAGTAELTAEQFIAVINHVTKPWRALVLFLVTTGLRWSEASGLRWTDVDLELGEATIVRSNDRGEPVDSVKTTGSNRTVPVLPEVAELLGKRRTGLVFPNGKGKLHRGYPLIKVLTTACKAAGAPRVTAHGLRRTFNNLARQLTSREVLKSITGHMTDRMVEHYSMVGSAEQMRAAKAVGGVLKVSRRDPGEVVN